MIDPLYQSRLELIHSAMIAQRVIQCKINHTWRTIEPYVTGLQSGTQAPCLYGFCRDMTQDRWQVLSLAEIDAIELTYYQFEPHCDYSGQHELFEQVYRQVLLSQLVEKYGGYPVRPLKKPLMRLVASAGRLRLKS